MKSPVIFALVTAASAVTFAANSAACTPSTTSIPNGISVDVSGCHLQIQNPEVISTGVGTEVVVRDPLNGEIGSDGGAITTAIGSLQDVNNIQQGQINTNSTNISQNATDITSIQGQVTSNDTDITNLQNEDVNLQNQISDNDSEISDLQSENVAQQSEIDANTAGVAANTSTNATQQGQIDQNAADISTNAGNIASNTAKNTEQDGRLDTHQATLISHGETIVDHGAAIDANSALISENIARLDRQGAKLDEHDKLLAIAMAMPDSWLSDKKSFGVFGAVGGTGDETAIGFAAIGRLDETWTVNAKIGADVEFDQVGWQAGFGAQW